MNKLFFFFFFPGIEERLHNLENVLKIGPEMPVPKDVYARLKAVEDRVLHLEGISPEYFRNIVSIVLILR